MYIYYIHVSFLNFNLSPAVEAVDFLLDTPCSYLKYDVWCPSVPADLWAPDLQATSSTSVSAKLLP